MLNKITFLFLLGFLQYKGYTQVSIDTIVIKNASSLYDDKQSDNYSSIGWPHRGSVGSKWGESYLDSIKSCGQLIDKYNQQYFLIVKDENDTIRLKGDFFDAYPNGHIILYNSEGFMISEGECKIFRPKKGQCYSKKIGVWRIYNRKGILESEQDYGEGRKKPKKI